jgi:hypothetical protein
MTNWYKSFGPSDWPGVSINTGDKKIDGTYYNVLGAQNAQLAASGYMWLAAKSGVVLVSEGFVDVSGFRAKNLQFQDSYRIDVSGNIIDAYPGPTGAILFKYDQSTVSGIPDDKLLYDTEKSMITMPGYSYGALYVSSGTADNPDTHELASFTPVSFVPAITEAGEEGEEDTELSPAQVVIDATTIIKKDIQIYPNFDSYAGSILTHQGADTPAKWSEANYLEAEGVSWNRFPKRPVLIQDGRIIFYTEEPAWAQDWQDLPTGDEGIAILEAEFGTGNDTIELINLITRDIANVKFASEIRYILDQISDPAVEPELPGPAFEEISFVDPDGDPDAVLTGIAVYICPGSPQWKTRAGADVDEVYIGNGYAFSVTKGGYMDMQISPLAIDSFSCDTDTGDTFKFKPSTLNSISIRPETHTAFNMLGENIDFVVYGKRDTLYGNYTEIFDRGDDNLPVGLIPALRIDANATNAASGNATSGVFFTKFLDREKVTPSGWSYDTRSKITINTNNPYIVSSLPTGVSTIEGVAVTGYIHHYADLTINASLYSQEIISEDIYLKPKPLTDGSGKYITNALLTLDSNGKIVSRVPKGNAILPDAPRNIVLSQGNGLGNSEISILWSAPLSDGNSEIIKYIIEFTINDSEEWTELPTGNYLLSRANELVKEASILGLNPLMSYKFRVAAQNSIGIGPFSEASDLFTLAASSVPKSPLNFSANRIFDDTAYSDIELSWSANDQGVSEILGYTIQESDDGGNTWYNYNTYSNLIDSTTETISGTESLTDFYYRISAWNASGQSAYAYVYASGNYNPETDPDVAEENLAEQLSNWDFGTILFTGVCP